MRYIPRLLRVLLHPLFVVFDAVGVVLCAVTVFLPSDVHPLFFTLGSVLLTIGITLPPAVFFQAISNERAFKILNACNAAGVESVFVSRKSDWADLRAAIDFALSGASKISLLGIAFKCDAKRS